jgi:hypothetical protein
MTSLDNETEEAIAAIRTLDDIISRTEQNTALLDDWCVIEDDDEKHSFVDLTPKPFHDRTVFTVAAKAAWRRCCQSYRRDWFINMSSLTLQIADLRNAQTIDIETNDNIDHLQFVLDGILSKGEPKKIEIVKFVDHPNGTFALVNNNLLPEQAEDSSKYIRTCIDGYHNETFEEHYSSNDTHCRRFKVHVGKLMEDGWIPFYEKFYIYWYKPTEIILTDNGIMKPPTGFSTRHTPEQVW